MTSSIVEIGHLLALSVVVSEESLSVDLSDGRTVTIPLTWYPRLAHAKPAERTNWRFIAGGEGIHWPDLDEDIPVSALLAGKGSAESQTSLQRWLDSRKGS